jgi:hypothetical protein
MPRPGPQAKKPSSRRSSRAFSKACGERLHQWKASRSSGSPQLPQEETSLKRAAQCSFCGSELYHFPPVDEKDGDLRPVPCCQRRIRVHVHFSELVRELAPQPLAQRPKIRTEVAPGPDIQFEVERRVGHRDGMRTVSRSSRPVNAPHPVGQGWRCASFPLDLLPLEGYLPAVVLGMRDASGGDDGVAHPCSIWRRQNRDRHRSRLAP